MAGLGFKPGLGFRAVPGHGNLQNKEDTENALREAIKHIETLNNSDHIFINSDHKKRMLEYGTRILNGETIEEVNIESLRDYDPDKEWFIKFLRDTPRISTGGRRKHRTRRNKKQRKQRKHRTRKH